MVLLAFSLQDQVEKYGAYVGLAAFFGLAVLTLLYFAQAREVKRLREWAARAPELGSELEDAIHDFEERLRRAPVAQPQPQPQVLPAPVAAPVPVVANGAVALKPEEVAALAFARAAGVREPHPPHPPRPHPVPAAAVAAPAPPSQVVAPAPEPTVAPAPVATNGGGSGAAPPVIPSPATPAARRLDPLPPRRPAPASRRPAAPPPRRESNTRAVVLTAILGVLVLAGAAFGATQLIGGDEPEQLPPNQVKTSAPEEDDVEPTATAAPAVTKQDALIAVYNGTSQTGLAKTFYDMLQGDAFPAANLMYETAPPDLQRDTSVVMYKRGSRAVAAEVGASLDIADVQQFDDPTKAQVAKSGKDLNVVVIVGQDKSQ